MKINKGIKSGISLIVLMITIVVFMVIASTIVLTTGDGIDDTRLVTFSEEISLIQDQSKVYYIQNEEFPLQENTTSLSQQELISLGSFNLEYETAFRQELVNNGDNQSNESLGEFYVLDITKLGIENIKKGTKSSGETDVYVISYPSMNVYYLKGIKLQGTNIYFSLSKNLNSIINVENVANDTSVTTVQTVSLLTVKSDNKTWSNKLGIIVQGIVESDEEIYLNITGIANSKKITTVTGINNFKFDTFADFKSVTNITDVEINTFNALQTTDKSIEFIKKKNGVNVGSIKIDLSKYEYIPPILDGNTSVSSNETENIVTFKVADLNGSGIKTVKYDYLNKFNLNGQIVNYYEGITDFDVSYLRTKGKKVNISSDGKAQIRIPKDIEAIQIFIQDSAGNWTKVIKSIRNTTYIGYVPNFVDNTQVDFNLIINSLNGISSVITSLSLDGGLTYNNQQDYSSPTFGNIEIINCNRYKNIYGIKDDVYIKVVIIDKNAIVANRITETRIIKITNKDRYIDLGLVLWLDGVKNTENGHSSVVTTWKDLSPKNNVVNLNGFNYTAASGWTTNGMQFDGIDDYVSSNINIANSDRTVEFVVSNYENNALYFDGDISLNTTANCLFLWNAYTESRKNTMGETKIIYNLLTTVKAYYTVTVSSSLLSMYKNGVLVSSVTNTTGLFGGITANIGRSGIGGQFGKLILNSARIYNRVLTLDEIKQNYVLDKNRYGI